MNIDKNRIEKTVQNLTKRLLDYRENAGYWIGNLSSSALSTAAAVFALASADRDKYKPQIDNGLKWLCDNHNTDGGWGDTAKSISNISTTLLCWSALSVSDENPDYKNAIVSAENRIIKNAGSPEPRKLAEAINLQYGSDKTFSAPILTMLALAGRLGDKQDAWKLIEPFPFEFAALPHGFFKLLNLTVVSYALPALIACGQIHFKNRKPANQLKKILRHLTQISTLKKLERIQPESGGFLEAIPLTSFVTMSLIAAGKKDNIVVKKGIRFLLDSVRADGSWPIDINLSTWVSTLSINALAQLPAFTEILAEPQKNTLKQWLLSQQYTRPHPYTNADPGGWAWCDLPGAVPDADDTAGALLALFNLDPTEPTVIQSASNGINWLIGLQNSDGGIPTFCRGWNKLPFDRSSPDITSHAINAFNRWFDKFDAAKQRKIESALFRALKYLADAQREDGSWVPLWFGNQFAPQQQNPVYGTGKVLSNLSDLPDKFADKFLPMVHKAAAYLLSVQNKDSGWGGAKSVKSSVEETAVALDGLSSILNAGFIRKKSNQKSNLPIEKIEQSISKGARRLMDIIGDGSKFEPAPIGLYFAKLWYSEQLYPVIFSLSALGKTAKIL